MDVSHLLDGLNPAQRDAVTAEPGHYLVLAGAGSGKTRVLVHRIGWLIEVLGVPPHGILAVTFTNKAAGEMRQRVAALLGQTGDGRAPRGGMWVGTFHGIAHRLLRLHWQDARLPESFQVLDSDDQQRLLKRVIAELGVDDKRFPPRLAAWFVNQCKDEGKRPQHVQANDPHAETLREIYANYEAACQRSGLVDFAELLLRAHELLRDQPGLLAHYQQRFRQLLVDEFQDTNAIQYAFIRLLAGEHGHVLVVGDDDQAIYGWRGAKVEHVHDFLRDFPSAQTVRLEQNYRSTSTILAAANAIIANNSDRLGKNLWTDGADGEPIDLFHAYNETDEARYLVERVQQWVAAGGQARDCAVLYRSNAQSRAFEDALMQAGMPYRVYGGLRFFDRAEIRDTLAYLRLLANRADDAAFERAVNTPARGIGERTLDALRRRARVDNAPLWEALLAEIIDGQLAGRARQALRGFAELIEQLAVECRDRALAEQIDQVLLRSGLRAYYAEESRGMLDSRTDNLDELVTVASRFAPSDIEDEGLPELVSFLAFASLEAGEGQAEAWEDGVQLMSLHAAKGLEFPLVFVAGMEEGIFPSRKALEESGRLDEERRLAYVGITRARERLIVSHAEQRRIHGVDLIGQPSRFLREIPAALMHEVRPRQQQVRASGYGMPRPATPLVEDPGHGLKLGQRVRHMNFGDGIIVDAEGSGAHARVQVNFDDVGAKWMVVAYAKLLRV
jgi:DNA helicase II / ATP-dependent DNA helicase PcrA